MRRKIVPALNRDKLAKTDAAVVRSSMMRRRKTDVWARMGRYESEDLSKLEEKYHEASRIYFFFFSSRRRHTRLQGDWSSDVCSSDLCREPQGALRLLHRGTLRGRHRPAGLGSEVDARRACAVEGSLRLPARRRSISDRRDRKSVV